MPDYSAGKIYKLQCEDGHFYIGSTRNELRKRFQDHKRKSVETPDRRVYNHINAIGWENVKIILVESFPCQTKDQLVQREDYHIQTHIGDLMCLNMKHSVFNFEKANQKKKEYILQHRDEITQRQSIYRDANRERINELRRLRYLKKKLLA